MHDDQQLLREFASNASRQALDELIRRYLGLVYSSALRQVRNGALAEDVTQSVFLILTQKARTIRSGVAVGGWLISVTRSVAVNVMKKQSAQRIQEQKAARPEAVSATAGAWGEISQVIDKELARLARKDRDAIVLRYFQDRSFRQIALELGLTEEAARKRVARSLQRLRARLKPRDRSLDASGIGAALAAFGIGAVPGHLLTKTIAALGGSPTIQGVLLMKGALKMIAYQKAKLIGAVAATLVLGMTGGVILQHALAGFGGQAPVLAAPQQAADPSPIVLAAVPAQTPKNLSVHINMDDPAADSGEDGPKTRIVQVAIPTGGTLLHAVDQGERASGWGAVVVPAGDGAWISGGGGSAGGAGSASSVAIGGGAASTMGPDGPVSGTNAGSVSMIGSSMPPGTRSILVPRGTFRSLPATPATPVPGVAGQ